MINIHIDELVLHGFPEADAPLIREAITQELTRLFTARSTLPAFGQPAHVERLNAGSFRIGTNAGAEAIGGQIAQSVFSQFTI